MKKSQIIGLKGLSPNAVFAIPPAGGFQILVNFFENFLNPETSGLPERAFGDRPLKIKRTFVSDKHKGSLSPPLS